MTLHHPSSSTDVPSLVLHLRCSNTNINVVTKRNKSCYQKSHPKYLSPFPQSPQTLIANLATRLRPELEKRAGKKSACRRLHSPPCVSTARLARRSSQERSNERRSSSSHARACNHASSPSLLSTLHQRPLSLSPSPSCASP